MPSQIVYAFLAQMDAGTLDGNLTTELHKLSGAEMEELATILIERENQRSRRCPPDTIERDSE